MINKSVILHQVEFDGSTLSFKEIQPPFDSIWPQSLQIDSSFNISWKYIPEKTEEIPVPKIPNYSPRINAIEDTTRDLFKVIDEQQERIDELTDKLNYIINFLK